MSKHAPTNDRHNTFEAIMKILGTFGPEQAELIQVLSQPLLQAFHVRIIYLSLKIEWDHIITFGVFLIFGRFA